MPCCRDHELVNPWKGKIVFGVGLVKISVVNTHSPLVVDFLDHDHVSEPCWVNNVSDEPNIFEVFHLTLDCFIFSVLNALIFIFIAWSIIFGYIERVSDQIWRNFGHVGVRPSENMLFLF